MPDPILLLSDSSDDDDDKNNPKLKSPVNNNNNNQSKRHRSSSLLQNPNFCVIDIDDPTPPPPPKLHKSSSPTTTSFVPVTPLSDFNDPLFIRCDSLTSYDVVSNFPLPSSPPPPPLNSPGADRLICLPSDDEAGGSGRGDFLKNMGVCAGFDVEDDSERSLECIVKKKQLEDKEAVPGFDLDSWLDIDSTCCLHKGTKSTKTYDRTHMEDDTYQIPPVQNHDHDKENVRLEEEGAFCKSDNGDKANAEKSKDKQAANKKKSVEEKMRLAEEKKRLAEEKKLKKEQEKQHKADLKAEAARLKQLEKDRKKSEKYKFSETDIVAEIHPNIMQLGLIAGPLLTALSGKNLKYKLVRNPFENSIVWRMEPPKAMSQLSTVKTDIHYILLIYDDAGEFCNFVNGGSLMDHISSVRNHYPSYTICCLTNRLMSFINKREQQKYKNHKDASNWKRPPVEEVFAKLTTQFANVHSRQCVDESEVAEYIVGLTINLAKCYSRKKLTHLSVNANGCNVPKDCVDRKLILKHPWLKALVSIPKVQPRFAIAIWKKYPTMKSLLRAYMDPTKTVREKESLLEDLPVEDLLGDEQRRLGAICSKRVFRILMAQDGTISTDDAENGADFFSKQ